MKKGFTLVELVIVIVIVGILSIVAVPIYNQYVEKAKLTEGMAALSAIKIAQDVYFAQHGAYYGDGNTIVQYDDILGIDLRGNKYFKSFRTHDDIAAGFTGVYDDDAQQMIGHNFNRPGSPNFIYTINGISKEAPFMYLRDSKKGTMAFI